MDEHAAYPIRKPGTRLLGRRVVNLVNRELEYLYEIITF